MTALIRPSQDGDVPRLTAIYAHHVEHGSGSFELSAPDEPEMARRRMAVLENHLPYLVAEVGGEVMGLCLCKSFPPSTSLPLLGGELCLHRPRSAKARPGPRPDGRTHPAL